MGKRPEAKTKQLYYRRATWADQGKITLEDILREAHELFKTTSERTFEWNYGAEIRCARYVQNGNIGIFFQIGSCIPGQSASIIEKSSSVKSESGIHEVIAPDGNDFLDGDIFLFVSKNDVILLPSGLRENTAIGYICKIIEKTNNKKIIHTFDLQKIAKIDIVKTIKDQGVKSIELNTSLYEASLMHLERERGENESEARVFNLYGVMANAIKDLFRKDDTYKDIAEKENLNIRISVSFDGKEARRRKKDPDFGALGRSRLKKVSEKIVHESEDGSHDGFTIITGDGLKIQQDEIVVSEKSRIKTFGNSIDFQDAFKKIEEYYLHLKGSGILSQ